jgi:hypothetical protein
MTAKLNQFSGTVRPITFAEGAFRFLGNVMNLAQLRLFPQRSEKCWAFNIMVERRDNLFVQVVSPQR